jgi:hypothetical protein
MHQAPQPLSPGKLYPAAPIQPEPICVFNRPRYPARPVCICQARRESSLVAASIGLGVEARNLPALAESIVQCSMGVCASLSLNRSSQPGKRKVAAHVLLLPLRLSQPKSD